MPLTTTFKENMCFKENIHPIPSVGSPKSLNRVNPIVRYRVDKFSVYVYIKPQAKDVKTKLFGNNVPKKTALERLANKQTF